jgi:LmbE family N-acetylglucosaminyl deacetylase
MATETPFLSLLGVWAHPDDEAYLSAGLMRRLRREGQPVSCVTATAGELGTEDPETWPPARLAEHRTRELRSALAVLGVGEPVMLGLPDGGCDAVPDDEGAAMVAAVLDEVEPDVVVTFGPDGITGHPDHRAVGRWTTAAWHRRGRRGVLVYAAKDRRFVRRFGPVHRRLGLFPPGLPVVTPVHELAFEVRLTDDELDAKRAALGVHASQSEGLARAMGEPTYRHWMDVESFRSPRPHEVPSGEGPIPTLDRAMVEALGPSPAPMVLGRAS